MYVSISGYVHYKGLQNCIIVVLFLGMKYITFPSNYEYSFPFSVKLYGYFIIEILPYSYDDVKYIYIKL